MTTQPVNASLALDTPTAVVDLDLVIPVYNEQKDLAAAVRRLHDYATSNLAHSFRITVADNASTDDTWQIATALAEEFAEVSAYHLDAKGRGRALRAVWSQSNAAVQVYMDVDLSTGLNALPALVAPLLSGHSQIAIGTRLAGTSNVVRGPKRELISRSYNFILRRTLGVHFSDAQCGFKAIRRDAAAALLPLVKDTAWFFDTELLVLAERSGMRIHEVPVDWIDDPESTVHIRSTAIEDLKGIARMQRSLRRDAGALQRIREDFSPPITAQPPSSGIVGQLVKFAGIGVLSTIAYAFIFLAMKSFESSQVANFSALLITAIGNTALNRRFTFGVRGRVSAGRHQLQGLGVFMVGWAITSAALFLLHRFDPAPSPIVEVGILTVANGLATVARFVLMRGWVFKKRPTLPVG
ncbi:bifunctional glycosyltransferase family 2/GtrA family protein [Antricoccus suffuscus]|nr:bifunctional glycosyltransferase family 2/GtrA family protein [Antricoccus suffuscus]